MSALEILGSGFQTMHIWGHFLKEVSLAFVGRLYVQVYLRKGACITRVDGKYIKKLSNLHTNCRIQ